MLLRLHAGGTLLAALACTALCCGGEHEPPGQPIAAPLPAAAVARRAADQAQAIATSVRRKQILFGDLHVHSTFSMDAFAMSLPLRGGEGAHPPADACDFARFCAGLDFFSINDHAESITPQHWRETVESIRACNAVSGDSEDPDLVAFLGWEWTQVGTDPSNHYGHKNVVLLETDVGRVPRRPISAERPDFRAVSIPLMGKLSLPLLDFANRQRYFDFFHLLDEIASVPVCPPHVATRDLPADCRESVRTPSELFERLDAWDTPSIVIPHGTTWGLSTPPGSSWVSQLDQHDARRESLFEIYSGHGGSEEYRRWRSVTTTDGGDTCPAPTEEYTPCCWRAGEIIRSRCGDAAAEACEERVAAARRNFVAAGVAGYRTVSGASVEDWLDCGQCRDCFLPAFDYRPAMSAQLALAESAPPTADRRGHFRFGFIGSSDTHSARAGKGYKELDRQRMIDAGLGSTFGMRGRTSAADAESRPVRLADLPIEQRRYGERGVSLIVGGGLVAVHAPRRDRLSIWEALEAKEVYGTSGPRILLWFDLLNGPDGPAPMGSEVTLAEPPRFRVSAVGSLQQTPGCPREVTELVMPQRLQRLCGGECHHPGNQRHSIARIEVVRIRPRQSPAEAVADLIEDPWRTHECAPAADGCTFEFDDPNLVDSGRGAVYYVRALQTATAAINGGGLRCQYDADGNCLAVSPCYSDERTPRGDDCLDEVMERAWSSPIFLQYQHSAPAAG